MPNPFHLDTALLNHPQSTRWGNLGYWAENPKLDYPTACEALARKVGRAARLRAGGRMLDVGCGEGEQLRLWVEQFGVGEIVGREIRSAAVAATRRRWAGWDLPATLRLQVGAASDLGDLAAERFDSVVSVDSAYHYRPRLWFLAHAWRVLKPGGRLALTDLLFRTDTPGWVRPAVRVGGRMAVIPPENWLTPAAYRAQLQGVGFSGSKISLMPLDEAVYGGFSSFIWRHFRRNFWQTPDSGWLKPLATGMLGAGLSRWPLLHYALIVAEK